MVTLSLKLLEIKIQSTQTADYDCLFDYVTQTAMSISTCLTRNKYVSQAVTIHLGVLHNNVM